MTETDIVLLSFTPTPWCEGSDGNVKLSASERFPPPRIRLLCLVVPGFICPGAALGRPSPAEASNWQTAVCLGSLTGRPSQCSPAWVPARRQSSA